MRVQQLSLLSIFRLLLIGFFISTAATAQETATTDLKTLGIDALFQLKSVRDPQISPDGEWIAYVISQKNLEKDKSSSQIWMLPAGGGQAIALTAADQSSSNPRWSPDGQYLAFLSARSDEPTQIWKLYRQGGEAIQISDTAASIESFAWAPDSARILFVMQDPSPAELEAKDGDSSEEEKTRPPWVIDRQQFKTDYVGYLDRRRTHIYSLNTTSGAVDQMTFGDFDDSEATWSPDGTKIAFTSNRTEDADNNYNDDIWVIESAVDSAPAEPLKISSSFGPDGAPAWSPDGKQITHTTITNFEAVVYATVHLSVSDSSGDDSRVLTEKLDRMISKPQFTADGKSIWFMLEDNGQQHLASISAKGGSIDRLISGDSVVYDFAIGRKFAAPLVSTPHLPAEIFRYSGKQLKQLSFANQDWMKDLSLGEVEAVHYDSADGTRIDGFVIKPPGFVEGKAYAAILDIHGGPQAQYDVSFNLEAQIYAAQGYLVIHPNPRGSTGKGEAFCLGIWQAWGEPDYEDVMAAVDDAIERGWADPDRLAVTGWSYGGMLTNHVITKTDRFKAAISGASATLYAVNYGHDMYQRWWEQELGLPWEPESRARYEAISPFNNLANVVTPTLILGGEIDWNVPIINSEQLYLALKKLGVETQLVVYPGEYHGIDTPSHTQDLYQRYLAWFKKYL